MTSPGFILSIVRVKSGEPPVKPTGLTVRSTSGAKLETSVSTISNYTLKLDSSNMQSNVSAVVTPAEVTDRVYWTSSNPSVASVAGSNRTAVITGKTAGTATISVTVGTLTKKILVTVAASIIAYKLDGDLPLNAASLDGDDHLRTAQGAEGQLDLPVLAAGGHSAHRDSLRIAGGHSHLAVGQVQAAGEFQLRGIAEAVLSGPGVGTPPHDVPPIRQMMKRSVFMKISTKRRLLSLLLALIMVLSMAPTALLSNSGGTDTCQP